MPGGGEYPLALTAATRDLRIGGLGGRGSTGDGHAVATHCRVSSSYTGPGCFLAAGEPATRDCELSSVIARGAEPFTCVLKQYPLSSTTRCDV